MFTLCFIPDPPDLPDLVPSVCAPNVDHQSEDVVPGLSLHHRRVREHAAVPADVPEVPRRLAALVPHPKTCVPHDVELAIRIERQTVAASLVVCARSEDGRVILRHLKADRLRAVDELEELRHTLPAVHPAPADFTFGGQSLAIAFCNIARLTERF